jgi:hypothetical protein
MSHPFEFLLRGARKAGFAEGLQTGRQEVERELANLQGYVKQLEDQLRKEGNWRVAKVTQARRDDDSNVREQRVKARPIRNITAAHRVVKSLTPAAIPLPILSTNTREVNRNTNNSHYCHPNPWGSISRRRGRRFRCIRTSQSNFRSPNTSYIQYIIPPLRPTFTTDLMSSSLSFPARLFSRIFHRDEGVAMRKGGTWSSGSRVPGIP